MTKSTCTVPVKDLECLFVEQMYAQALSIQFGTDCEDDIEKLESILLASCLDCMDCVMCQIKNSADDILYRTGFVRKDPCKAVYVDCSETTVVAVPKSTGKLPKNNVIPFKPC